MNELTGIIALTSSILFLALAFYFYWKYVYVPINEEMKAEELLMAEEIAMRDSGGAFCD